MNIRIMTANDYDAVYALWMSCIGMGLNTIDDSKEGITKFLIRNPETCFVAESGEKITLVVFGKNKSRNDFWEKMGFTSRDDLVYRNKALTDICRIDT